MRESLLVIDKSPGPTSFDVVREVKRLCRGVKVGHTGSLDPFASGVLVLLLGRATKLSSTLLNADKSYVARVQLGKATDTMDCMGQVIEEVPVPPLTEERVKEVLKSFEGTWSQTPPMYSAKKVGGVRLYELARKNIQIDRAPIPVELYSLKFHGFTETTLDFEVHCSKGTYVRALAEEIGRRLGTVGHLVTLRRLSCGEFKLEEAVTVEALKQNFEKEVVRGYDLFLKLLRSETRISRPETRAAGFPGSPVRPVHRQLQMPVKGGNSWHT